MSLKQELEEKIDKGEATEIDFKMWDALVMIAGNRAAQITALFVDPNQEIFLFTAKKTQPDF